MNFKYQYLLGKVSTDVAKKQKTFTTEYQYLLGKVSTLFLVSNEPPTRLYQYLLGKVSTKQLEIGWGVDIVSISIR